MSFTEFHQAMSKSKSEPNQSMMASCPPDLSSFMPDDELVELLWENRQIVMQGQSQRPNKKSPFSTAIPSHSARAQDKDGGSSKIRRFVAMDAITDNELSPAVPNAHIGTNAQDDNMVPWMNYPMEDPFQNDYCSEFFSEFPGLNLNSLSSHNNSVAADQSGGFSLGRDSRSVDQGQSMKPFTGGLEVNRVKTSQLFQSPQQCQSSISNGSRLKASEVGASSDSIAPQVPSGDMLGSRFLKQDISTSKPLQPSSSMGLMNFSHFTRPVALAKANLQSVDRLRSIEKAFTATSSNPVESALVDSASGLKNVSGMQGKSSDVPPKLDLRSSVKPSQKVASVAQSEAVCQEGASMSGNAHIADNQCRPPGHINHQSSSFTAVARHEAAKGPEAIVASSVCSGNKDGAASSDPKKRAKRKSHEGEESGYQSEDVDDESVGIMKAAGGRGTVTKRSRAAEVHNLSERRRRDRINEKMRALQELIPNCNRVDKASMLDEAIEYLKTLQLQVQIMSMGSGLCMPSMLLPAGMQPIRTPPMAHFSPVGMGMGMGLGMGMGYGMGVLNMNGSPGCPLIPVPSLHGSQFPYPSIPGAQGLHGVPGSTSLQVFGIPGQGLPLSIPRPTPPFGSFAGPAKLNLVPEASGTATSSDAAPASSSQEQQQQNLNSEIPQGTSADDSKISASA